MQKSQGVQPGMGAEGCRQKAVRLHFTVVQHFTAQGTHNSLWNYTGLHLDPHKAPLQLEITVEN